MDIASEISEQFDELLDEFIGSFQGQDVYAFKVYQVGRGLDSLDSISLEGDRAKLFRLLCTRFSVSFHLRKGDQIVKRHSPGHIAFYFATCCYCQKLLLPVEVKHFNEHNENGDDDLVWARQKMTECMHRNSNFPYHPDASDPFHGFVRRFEAALAEFQQELADNPVIVLNEEDELWYPADMCDIQIDSLENRFEFCVRYNDGLAPNREQNFEKVNPDLVRSDFGFCNHCHKYMPTPQLNIHLRSLARRQG